MQLPFTATNMAEWVRKGAFAVNFLLSQRQFPFVRLDAAPTSPEEGQGYYDTVLHKARVWDGSAWQNLY